jgi:hypothetical protein
MVQNGLIQRRRKDYFAQPSSRQAGDARQDPLLLHHGLDLLWRTRQEI